MTAPTNPRAIVMVGGERFDSFRDKSLFAGVEVELTTDEASEAVWRVFDPSFKFLDKWIEADGIAVLPAQVWVGFGDEMGRPVFSGLLARVEYGRAQTSFRFYDMGFKMRLVKKTEYHRGLNDVQIIARLATRNGLGFEGPNPAIRLDPHKSLMQDGQTDWEFAQERAEEVGLVLYVRGNTVYAKEAAKTGAPVTSFTYRADFIMLHDFSLSFKVPENQEGRPGRVETRGRGRGGRRLKGASTKNRRGNTKVEIRRDLAIKTKRHADRRAEARKLLQREHAFNNTVSILSAFRGRRPDVRDTVELLGLGKLFSGRYLCDRVAHRFAPGTLETQLDVYRDLKA